MKVMEKERGGTGRKREEDEKEKKKQRKGDGEGKVKDNYSSACLPGTSRYPLKSILW